MPLKSDLKMYKYIDKSWLRQNVFLYLCNIYTNLNTLNLNNLDIFFWYNERMVIEKTTSLEFGTIAPF